METHAPTMNRTGSGQRTWRLPRLLLEDQLGLAVLSWLGLVLFSMAVVTVVSSFRDIVISGWEVATGIVPWYAAFIGGYVLHTVLPLHIAHGRTRRDFAIEAVIFGGVFTTVVALLVTLGFAIEQGVYAIAGWSRGTPDDHLFASYTEYGMIVAEYWLTVLVWTAAGAFVGASVYRPSGLSWFALAPALGLVAISGLTRADSAQPMGFIVNRLPQADSMSLALTALLSLVSVLIALGLTWLTIRDMPMRNA
jgi:hypothetical protein